jgi:SAM-dependent methyltransferase
VTTAPAEPTALPALLAESLELLACPACGGALAAAPGAGLACQGCARAFPCSEGIPRLYWPNDWTGREDVTEVVKAFYEETPFPNYDEIDSSERLRAKAEQGLFARLLNEQIPFGARILEAGCGTGQLSNFLGLTWPRRVFGTDLCLNSLRLAEAFRAGQSIAGACFVQMNLFRPAFRAESFDVVVSNGVLHHTSDPLGGFRSLLRLLKPGGIVIVGLYNRFGRLTTDLRRVLFRLSGDRAKWVDPWLRRAGLGQAKQRAWFMDQYKHPHESKHTLGEVLAWFDRCAVEFLNGVPRCTAGEGLSPREELFAPHPRGSGFDHFAVQARMMLSGGREGGFFTMIGRKRHASERGRDLLPAERVGGEAEGRGGVPRGDVPPRS